MSVSVNLMSRVSAKVDKCINEASKRFGRTFTTPKITYDVRGTVGGYYSPAGHAVRFNPVLLIENVDHYIDSTVVHEVAHAIDHEYNNGYVTKPHGRTWKMIMRALGVEPSRTHNYNVDNAQVRVKNKFEYRCKHCGTLMTVGPSIHSKITRGQVRWHKECGKSLGSIVFVQALGQVTYGQAAEARASGTRPTPKKVVPAPVKKVNSGSKYEKARDIVMKMSIRYTSVSDIINEVMSECNMTKAGATTYYYKARKELGY